MSKVTGIKTIDNSFDKDLHFTNGEHSGNERNIPAFQQVSMGNCWVPWRKDSGVDMEEKRLTLTLTPKKKYYLWQYDTHIRYSVDTDPGTINGGAVVPGDSSVGSTKTLTVTEEGKLIMSQA